MTTAEFRDLVKRLRDAQKRWFDKKDRTALDEAKRLEREVDAELTMDGQQELFGSAK